MKLVDKIESVSHYEVFDDCVIIGRDTRIKEGIISHGDQILRKSDEGVKVLMEEPYFYFTAFIDGFLYYSNEGESIYHSNGSVAMKVTPEEHYFNPLHNLSQRKEVIITQMDKEFNQKHFFLSSTDFKTKIDCKIYPQLNNSNFYCRFHKKESWVEIIDKQVENSYRKVQIEVHEDKMDKREKPILDSNHMYLPLSRGNVAKYNCKSDNYDWVNYEFDEQYVSYSSNSLFLYQHFGLGINQISKDTGKTINRINFADVLKEKFQSSGRIWSSDKFVITKDLESGKFCVVDANTLKPLALEFVMIRGFSDSEITFQIMEDHIYVLAMDNILKQYELK